MPELKQTNTSKRNFIKFLIPIYAFYCLLEIPILTRWGGHTPKVYFYGLLISLLFFITPFIFTGFFAIIRSVFGKKSFIESFIEFFFDGLLTVFVVISSFFIFLWYFIGLAVSF